MGMRWMMGVAGLALGVFLALPSAWAADDESTAEAAQVPTAVEHPTRDQILQAIEETRLTDPELAAEMENQLQLLDSGELDLSAEGGVPHGTTQEGDVTLGGSNRAPIGFVGPPVDEQGEGMPSYMTPELQGQLGSVFDRVAAGELTEQEARAQADAILREHGIEVHDIEVQDLDRGAGFERAYMEQMSPEAREQMERFFSEHEATEQPTFDREMFEREFSTFEAPTHEYEAPTYEYEAPMHEYEAPQFEQPEYEPQGYDYQPPQSP
jgi:hypothetical protein